MSLFLSHTPYSVNGKQNALKLQNIFLTGNKMRWGNKNAVLPSRVGVRQYIGRGVRASGLVDRSFYTDKRRLY